MTKTERKENPRISKVDEDDIVDMYENGKSGVAIALELRLSPYHVYSVLKKNRLTQTPFGRWLPAEEERAIEQVRESEAIRITKMRMAREADPIKPIQITEAEVIELHGLGFPAEAIADSYEVEQEDVEDVIDTETKEFGFRGRIPRRAKTFDDAIKSAKENMIKVAATFNLLMDRGDREFIGDCYELALNAYVDLIWAEKLVMTEEEEQKELDKIQKKVDKWIDKHENVMDIDTRYLARWAREAIRNVDAKLDEYRENIEAFDEIMENLLGCDSSLEPIHMGEEFL